MIVNCKKCKHEFYAKPSNIKKGFAKYCSRTCYLPDLISLRKEDQFKKGRNASNEKNTQWKGNKVGYGALHTWITRHKPKPNKCEYCKINIPRDLANISQQYKRDINDFEWLCRKCHMIKDGRLKKLHPETNYALPNL